MSILVRLPYPVSDKQQGPPFPVRRLDAFTFTIESCRYCFPHFCGCTRTFQWNTCTLNLVHPKSLNTLALHRSARLNCCYCEFLLRTCGTGVASVTCAQQQKRPVSCLRDSIGSRHPPFLSPRKTAVSAIRTVSRRRRADRGEARSR